MSATFQFAESNGAGETVTDGISNVNFGSIDAPNITPASYPIPAGNNSYEKWVRGKFSGSYTAISNLRFWKSAGVYVTGEDIKAAANATFSTPVQTTSSIATVTVPTVEGSALNPSAPGASPSYSGYVTLQLQTTGSTPPGNANTKTFMLKLLLHNKIQQLLLLVATLIEYMSISVKLLFIGQYRGNLLLQRVRRDYTTYILMG